MLKLGVMGMSEANQHPYSWSAIVNGDYDADLMAACGSPHPPAYLAANRDTLGVDGAEVTHIWTQDRRVSEHCARACGIAHVVDRIEDLAGPVDGVLLLRDDPENHVAMAKPLIDAGVPLFIDKPLAFRRTDLDYFAAERARGRHIASCSSMRYSAGVQAGRAQMAGVGEVLLAVAVGKKDWRKYAVHYLEGLMALLGDPKADAVTHVSGKSGRDVAYVEFANGALATIHVFMDIAPAGELNVYGTRGHLSVDHGGAYTMFRNNIEQVVKGFRAAEPLIDFEKTRNVIAALIAGEESRLAGGKRVAIP